MAWKPQRLFASAKNLYLFVSCLRLVKRYMYDESLSPSPKHGADLSAQMTSLSPTREKSDSIALAFTGVLSLSSLSHSSGSLSLVRSLLLVTGRQLTPLQRQPALLICSVPWSDLHRAGPHLSNSRLLFHIHPIVSAYFHLSRASLIHPPSLLSLSPLCQLLSPSSLLESLCSVSLSCSVSVEGGARISGKTFGSLAVWADTALERVSERLFASVEGRRRRSVWSWDSCLKAVAQVCRSPPVDSLPRSFSSRGEPGQPGILILPLRGAADE